MSLPLPEPITRVAAPMSRQCAQDVALFELLIRKIFHSGFSRDVVDRRWSAFQNAFQGFDPAIVAEFTEDDARGLLHRSDLIRNRRKLFAAVHNARQVQRLILQHGSFAAWLESWSGAPFEQRVDTLAAYFEQMGINTAFWFLLEAGYATLDDYPNVHEFPPET
ncbi:MAG: DNA-3-methyladenine glycosylase I [Myxococcota bacterium]|nr:DNA-3-methyladenine glycosylase I [Myxococcota bacterium]